MGQNPKKSLAACNRSTNWHEWRVFSKPHEITEIKAQQMADQKYEFMSTSNHKLAGTISMPAGPVRATAIFAHCFTCTQASLAAKRISRALADRGIAVLRFDFTGLGESEGEFAEAGFASSVDDLLFAATFLGEVIAPPSLLIGHSLGGAAALVAASRIESLTALVTLGAPSDAVNVLKRIDGDLAAIERDGTGDVSIAGRPFRISTEFLAQARTANIVEGVAALRIPKLFAHAPRDEIVSIDHAGILFQAAKHPKSFVSLEDADHLLTRAADAEWAADIIAAWAARHLPDVEHAAAADGTVRVVSAQPGFSVDIAAGQHHWHADEPPSIGGSDSGPTPYDLLLGGLGACTAMTIRMVAAREHIPIDSVTIMLDHNRNHARDCDHCENLDARIEAIHRRIEISGELSTRQRERLLSVANKCPVHRTLTGELHIHDNTV